MQRRFDPSGSSSGRSIYSCLKKIPRDRNVIYACLKKIPRDRNVAALFDDEVCAVKNCLLFLLIVFRIADGKEEIAVDTLCAASKLVASGGNAAEELSKMFRTEKERIEGIIKQTIGKKAEEQKREARTRTQSIEDLHNAIGTLK